jgi:hypothetical protein
VVVAAAAAQGPAWICGSAPSFKLCKKSYDTTQGDKQIWFVGGEDMKNEQVVGSI